MKPMRAHQHTAFTLIELLVVVTIIAVLAALLFPALQLTRKKINRNVAIVEVKGIQVGLIHYLADNHNPPTFALESKAVAIDETIAEVLTGTNDDDNNNRPGTSYIEFKKLDDQGAPLNPWGYRYFFKFDVDYDNKIDSGTGEPPQDDVALPVIVWTMNEDLSESDENRLIASWR